VSLTGTLTEENLRTVGEKIAGLPTGDEFKRAVEDDLWREFTGMEEPPESIAWDELPEDSKSIVGYVDEEEETVPWWLGSFEWVASSRGEIIEGLSDNLSNLENFDPMATEVQKPELGNKRLVTVLDKFHELGDTINDNIRIDTEVEHLLPSNIFEIPDGRVRTTDEFTEWFDGVIQLCPPFNEVLTSLLMVNSNVRVESIEGLVSEELLEKLDSIGVIDGGRIYQEKYHGAINRILRSVTGVFDVYLPARDLELLFYQRWAENYREEGISEWISRASYSGTLEKGEEQRFGKISLYVPIRLTLYHIRDYNSEYRPRVIYTTCGMNTGGGYPSRNKSGKITRIMGSTEVLEE